MFFIDLVKLKFICLYREVRIIFFIRCGSRFQFFLFLYIIVESYREIRRRCCYFQTQPAKCAYFVTRIRPSKLKRHAVLLTSVLLVSPYQIITKDIVVHIHFNYLHAKAHYIYIQPLVTRFGQT
jgi:hypothetical protein